MVGSLFLFAMFGFVTVRDMVMFIVTVFVVSMFLTAVMMVVVGEFVFSVIGFACPEECERCASKEQ